MTTELLITIFMALMLAYIVFLHIQLTKKNVFIESTVKRLSGIENSWTAEEMMKFLHEIKKLSQYSAFFTDKLFEDKPMGFLLENAADARVFIHYTRNENDAKSILKEGFRFADSFYKTALPISSDKLDLLIKHNGRKSYGNYIIVLCFSVRIFNYYTSELDRSGLKGFSVENILTERLPSKNDNDDLIYQLSNRFVKGYINHQTGEIIRNPDYNPSYDTSAFIKNLDILKSRVLN